MVECPEKFPLFWLNGMIDDDEKFAAEALAIRQRIETYQPEHQRRTHTPASAAVGLVNHWLVQRDLHAYERGNLLDNFGELVVIPVEGCYGKGIESRQSSIFIMRDELVSLMRSHGMTIPFYLNGSREFAATDPVTYEKPLFAALPTASVPLSPAIEPNSSILAKKARVFPAGGDLLTRVIWEICYELTDAGEKIQPKLVMRRLREMAEQQIAPLVSVVDGGVKFEYEKGVENELDSDALRQRIRIWREKTGG